MSVTIFLRDGQVFALTVPEPNINDFWKADKPMEPVERFPDAGKAYELALASARESAVRVENNLKEITQWALPNGDMKGLTDEQLARLWVSDFFYQLPSEYKMRVENKRVKEDKCGILSMNCPYPECNCTMTQKVAIIYRDEPKATETPLSALRNKLSPFMNLAAMVKDAFDIAKIKITKEAERCDVEEVHRLLSELETPKEETQDELWKEAARIVYSETFVISALGSKEMAQLKAKFILTRKEGVTH